MRRMLATEVHRRLISNCNGASGRLLGKRAWSLPLSQTARQTRPSRAWQNIAPKGREIARISLCWQDMRPEGRISCRPSQSTTTIPERSSRDLQNPSSGTLVATSELHFQVRMTLGNPQTPFEGDFATLPRDILPGRRSAKRRRHRKGSEGFKEGRGIRVRQLPIGHSEQ